MAKLSKAKAKEMLHNPPHGKPLTEKQRKYFGYVANAELGLSMLGEEEPTPTFKNKKEHDSYYLKKSLDKLSPEDRQWYEDAVAGKVTNVTPETIITLRAPIPLYKPKLEPLGNPLGRAYGLKNGGIIEDDLGQLKHPGKITKIGSNNITMKGVKTPVLGISDLGDMKMMLPEKNYLFDGNNVTEFPIAKDGKWIQKAINPKHKGYCSPMTKETCTPKRKALAKTFKKHHGFHENGGNIPNDENITPNGTIVTSEEMNYGGNLSEYQAAKSGIHIKKSHKGLLHKNLGIPEGEKIPASKLKIKESDSPAVKKRKIFAQNAKKWKHQDGGEILSDETSLLKPINKSQFSKIKNNPLLIEQSVRELSRNNVNFLPDWANPNREWFEDNTKYIDDFGNLKSKPLYKKAQMGTYMTLPENANVFNQSPIQTNWGSENIYAPGQFSTSGQFNQFNNTLPQNNNLFNNVLGSADILGKVVQGIGLLNQNRENKNQARQSYKVSKLVKKAASLEPDKVKRKYTRPEDEILDPNETYSTYGTGTNYLQDGGILPIFNQIGQDRSGNFGEMFGSLIGGGQGMPSGASNIGGTLGGVAGNLIGGPIGGPIGSFLGGTLGGLIGGHNQKLARRYERRANNNLQSAAFSQGIKGLNNQYTSFMQNGGDITTHWGGYAEPVSQNPYLPDDGLSVLFKGNSHQERDRNGNTGIGMSFSGNPVEVENGEPAVKLNNGGDLNLTVFGDMKIPQYGLSELNDPKAKGKKFKNYVNDLNKQEEKQNKIGDNSIIEINTNTMGTPYDKLKFSSAKAMLLGSNMNLKNIAEKKQMASNIQNAILQTANEFNLDSAELAKGNVKKLKKSSKNAQNGDIIPSSISREEIQKWIDAGFNLIPDNPNRLYRTTNLPGKTEERNIPYKAGSEEFQKAFANARKNKLKEFDFKGKPYTTDLYDTRTNKISYPGSSKTDYIDIYDPRSITSKLTSIDPFDFNSIPQPITSPSEQPITKGRTKFDLMNTLNSVIPYLKPTNQLPLDYNQLSGEMYSLATNELDPVQAQLYHPLLENVSDISLQDQMNANQSDFNSLQRSLGKNPEALSSLAGQKYAANSKVLGEQFRQNQSNRLNTYNRNRSVLNDATLKNLAILDQQYVRQSQAKSNTKAVAKAALESIADKIAKNKLENKTLGIYENMYNYRFGPKGHAYNLNPFFIPNIPQVGEDLPLIDNNGMVSTEELRQKYDKVGNPQGSEKRQKVTKKSNNGSLIKALKNSNLKGY